MSIAVRTILITGAAHGLGREVASQLAGAGHHVIITARKADAAARTAEELGQRVDALPVDLDVSDDASVAAAAAALTATPGRLDTPINNAAAYVDWTEMGSTADLTTAHQVLGTNLFGAWRTSKALLPLLQRSEAPRIVNISSGAGSHEDPAFGLRSRGGAAAAALNALTSTLATEPADTTILVNSVCPGLTATFPGAKDMGARPVEDSARGVVWAATLPDNGPTGGFFRDTELLPW